MGWIQHFILKCFMRYLNLFLHLLDGNITDSHRRRRLKDFCVSRSHRCVCVQCVSGRKVFVCAGFSLVLLRLVIAITTNLIYMNSVLYVTHRLNILYTLRRTFTRDTKSVKSKNDEDTWWGFFCDIVIWNHFKMFNMWIYKRKKICDISVVWKPFLPTIIHNSFIDKFISCSSD